MSGRPLALFVGAASAPNVERVVDSFTAMLPGETHVIATDTDITTDVPTFGAEYSGTVRGEIGALDQYLRTHDPVAVVQVTRPPTHGTIAGVLAARHRVPFVYRYSGDRFYEYRVARGRDRLAALALGAGLGRLPIRLADRHIALGPVGKRRLIARGVAPASIDVLPPAVDTDRFLDPVPRSIDAPDDRSTVLTVGRLTHLKGAEALERIVPAVLDRRDDIQFVCVGEDSRGLDVPDEYRDHVTPVGRVPLAAVPGYMAAADVLCHPSLTEGIPRVLLESLAVGTPVVARRTGDIPSVTNNTVCDDAGFVDALVTFESLPVDDVTPFTREHLAPVVGRWRRTLGADDL